MIPVLFVLCMMAAWWAAGQPISALPGYFAAQAEIIAGYGDAMSVLGSPSEVILLAFAGLLLTLCTIGVSEQKHRWGITLATFLTLFVGFKAGVIRHDGHVALAAGTMLVVAAYVIPAAQGTCRKVLAAAAAGMALVVMSHYADVSPAGLLSRARAAVDDSWQSAAGQRQQASGYLAKHDHAIAFIRQSLPLQDFGKTVDLYPTEISAAILGSGRWSPRPVFQSYSAYSRPLIERNEAHLRDAPPERVYWRIQTIDGRYPSLDDGASWPWLLGRYRPVGFISDYLQLELKESSTRIPAGQLVIDKWLRLGEEVSLPAGSPLWVNVEIRPSLAGRLWSALYKLPALSMSLEYADGSRRSFRVVAGMMETGFLLSPTVNSTRQLEQLWAGGFSSVPAERVPVTIRIEVVGSATILYPDQYRLSVSRMAIPRVSAPDRSLDAVVGIPLSSIRRGGQCAFEARLEAGTQIVARRLTAESATIMLTGWVVGDVSRGAAGESAYLMLRDANGARKLIRSRRTYRADVASAFHNASLSETGFESVFDVTGLTRPVLVNALTLVHGHLLECADTPVTLN